MISPECFYDQYKLAFSHHVEGRPKLCIAEQLEGFFRMAAELKQQELPPIQFITMTCSPSFPVQEQNVLIPLSGGLASTACLWWTLKQGYTPWLFFADCFTPEANAAEREAVRRLVLSVCDQQGLPLCTESSQPRLIIRPFPYQGAQDDPILRTALLYFMAQEVAKAKGCCRIVWGALGLEQQVLRSLVPFFTHFEGDKGSELINSIFPFASPEQTMISLQECQLLSQQVQGLAEAGVRLGGAAICADLRTLCHSCKSQSRPSWNAGGTCPGCRGCSRWREVSMPSWRWDGHAASGVSMADWRPKLEGEPRSHTPSWTCNAKRQAFEEKILAKRRLEAEEEDRAALSEPTTMRVAKKTKLASNNKKATPAAPKAKAAATKRGGGQQKKVDLFAGYNLDEAGPLLDAGDDELRDKRAKPGSSEEDNDDGFDVEDEEDDEDEDEEEDEEEEEEEEDDIGLEKDDKELLNLDD